MKVRQSFRGRPVLALLTVLGLWVGVRALLWDVAAFAPGARAVPTLVADADRAGFPLPLDLAFGPVPGDFVPEAAAEIDRHTDEPALRPAALAPRRQGAGSVWPRYRLSGSSRIGDAVVGAHAHHSPILLYRPGSPWMEAPEALASARHLLASAVRQVPLPPGVAMPLAEAAGTARDYNPGVGSPPGTRHWSGDAWLLLRQGGNVALGSGVVPATYGASQAGGVLRYRFSPENGHRPTAYLRATTALNGSAERETALGVSARPVARFPLIAALEMRATAQPAGTRLRPAAMVVSELPSFELPFRTRGEAYAQAGYVGGRFATPFADGQLRVDRDVAGIGRNRLRAGMAAWAGAQKGASRLDVGPTAAMGLGLSESASARVAVDWRFRIAGEAAPASGPALTLSAGF